MFQRPKSNETEEDIIKQSGNFESSKSSGKHGADSKDNVNDSNLKESIWKKKREEICDQTVLNVAVKSKSVSSVLSPICARNIPSVLPSVKFQCVLEDDIKEKGGPETFKIKLESCDQSDSSNCSLYRKFAQKKFYDPVLTGGKCDVSATELQKNMKNFGVHSYIVKGESSLGSSNEAKKIHEENVKKLSNMSENEILEEREELLANIDQKSLEFLKSLRKNKTTATDNSSTFQNTNISKKFFSVNSNNRTSLTNTANTADVDSNMSCEEEQLKPVETNKQMEVDSMDSETLLKSLPIKLEQASKWANMNKVEINKLEWISEMEKPKPLTAGKYTARFNFNGDLLPFDLDVSWREGLHHHGEESGRAGYTVDELFMFVRSKVVQQRHVGWKTLANIIRNAYEGLYDTCFDSSILQLLIDGGIIILLRFAIDEKTGLVYQEALRALYYLITSEPDENCLVIAEPWIPMGIQPGVSSNIHSSEKDRKNLDEEEKELKDVEIIKLDVIRALVRMDLLIRLRYMLESPETHVTGVIHILAILRRIARHSQTAAWKVFETHDLITCIVDKFVPCATSGVFVRCSDLASAHGTPLSVALSFFKILACRGRSMASQLIQKHDVLSRLTSYVCLEPTESGIPPAEFCSLIREALGLWSVFLSYGLRKAEQEFTTFSPVFVKILLLYRDKIDLTIDEGMHFNHDIGAHLGNLLTRGLAVAATKPFLMHRMKQGIPTITNADGKEIILQPPSLDWQEFDKIMDIAITCTMKWVSQFTNNLSDIKFNGYKMLGSFMNLINMYISKWRDQTNFDSTAFNAKLEWVRSKILNPLLSSKILNHLFDKLLKYSAICSAHVYGCDRNPANLGSICCVSRGGEVTPILQKGSPYSLILPFTNLLKTVASLDQTCATLIKNTVFENQNLFTYFHGIIKSHLSLSKQFLTRNEIYIVTNLLTMSNLSRYSSRLLHEVALTIIPIINKGDEVLIKSVLKNVIFEPRFCEDLTDVESDLLKLNFKDFNPLPSPAFAQPTLSSKMLTQKLLENLPSIGQNLIKSLISQDDLSKSLCRFDSINFLINNLFVELLDEISVLDNYWTLFPFKLLLADSKQIKRSTSSQDHVISAIKWIQATYLLANHRKSVLVLRMDTTQLFYSLSNILLCSTDFFLDSVLNSYTQAVLFSILNDSAHNLNYSIVPHSHVSSYDWYKMMIEQYSSVAYSDSLFGIFIVVPLLRRWPNNFKLLLFSEQSDCLPFVRLTCDQVSSFIPLKLFFEPAETDPHLLSLYKSAVVSQNVSEKRNQFLYKFIQSHLRKN